jgi:hypothetical protein
MMSELLSTLASRAEEMTQVSLTMERNLSFLLFMMIAHINYDLI